MYMLSESYSSTIFNKIIIQHIIFLGDITMFKPVYNMVLRNECI